MQDTKQTGAGGVDAALRITGLRFAFPDAEPGAAPTVDVADLTLNRGEQVLLTAGSGKGKSTLLTIIAGLMEPTSGKVLVAGSDVHALRGASRDAFRGRHIGMVFQTFNLLPGFTARENVLAALMFSGVAAAEQDRRADALLKRLGIERADAPVEKLSVGQQQRVAVARAVACDPVLVLADEPTASLDPENAATAIGLIQESCRERNAALLCVSHDPAMSERFATRRRLEDLAGAAV